MSIGIVACGAIALEIETIQRDHSLDITIYPLPPLLHNSPKKIPSEVDQLLTRMKDLHEKRAVAYADCGTYGALDEILDRHGVPRLSGNHCYDVYLGKKKFDEMVSEQPGTYFLTDFLVKSFNRSVIIEMGLDRYPELHDDYFKNYERVVWLAQNRTPELERLAHECANQLALPLEIVEVGLSGLALEILNFAKN
ncbi:MAG: DUF1638 domain-containing protein [Actinomycetota bacterium]